MLIFKALHILSMVTMVMLFSGGELYYAFAIRARNVRALAWLQSTERRNGIAFFALGALLSGILFGLLTAATGGLDFFDGWLIAAYVLVAVILVGGGLLWPRKLLPLGVKAVEAEAGQRPVEDVVRDMAASPAARWFAVMATLFVLIILDMVLKPF